jgi:mono/diheme cytochrome c family protein
MPVVCGLLMGPALSPSAAGAAGDAKAGKIIYDKHCVACHGRGGKGIGALPDLSDPRTLANRSDESLIKKITNGGQGSGMPAWGSVLSEQQRWDVLAFIKTLAK